ncbi:MULTISPECIES: hypothetical protein [Ruminococcus]|uniref:Uncharacterized protein n=1 Tax=Ruminococcus albus (strain ATCC 27210 / DSM 20455 / JCM 14654 / NCDO 2250 / 7) TaxID=697329 RepID=E6UEP1_RUMA7|nr:MULTISPECIES: hypothetical protein [Ruminococcus]ADU21810.1 hypothetical protein Rumal_1295 [Ruminococcus albus 7 = DSM 20455]
MKYAQTGAEDTDIKGGGAVEQEAVSDVFTEAEVSVQVVGEP